MTIDLPEEATPLPQTNTASGSSAKEIYEPKHLPALDGVRGLAISLVLLMHGSEMILRDLPIAKYLSFGWMGVDLFFVLSGFLITRILLDTQGDPAYFRRFYIRRGLRIWPLYYVFLACMLLQMHLLAKPAFSASTGGAEHFQFILVTPVYLYLFFVQNLYPRSLFCFQDSILTITWSLCIEEHFYLVWPACVRIFSRRNLFRILIAILAISPFLRLAMAYVDRSQPYLVWYQTIYRLTPFHIDSITAGCLLCLAWSAIRKNSRAIYWFAGLFGVGFMFTVICLLNDENRTLISFCFTAVTAMFAGLVGMSLMGWFSSLFTLRFLRYLGKISFGLYLIHPTVFLVFQSHRLYEKIGMANHLVLAECLAAILAFGLSIYISHLSWKFFESRVLALKARLAP
jgi:peptidoglycan/LPS O-acetylase OafA/YrhL